MPNNQWPFKHINRHSSWPMQGLVVNFAAAVLQVPESQRKAAAHKMIERCVRMGARLAREFGMDAQTFVSVAAAQIAREGGSQAKAQLASMAGPGKTLTLAEADEAVAAMQAQVEAIFKGADLPPVKDGDEDDTPEA